ncbi:MAG: hypothetical protein OXP12_09420 [Thaumarchaeota archaeon]|nr:hypothetical protein [Nitrososphaerota archaeon]MDE0266282.1 hypothetical protein [Nitrososphaerota archaeon]MDE0526634.1 hypothetical protein [Nitrososphaerota archaeon]
MELASRRLPLMIIGVLLAILVVQYVANTSDGPASRLIDPATCQIYEPIPGGGKSYLDEFDQKCLDLRALAP